MTAKLLKMQLLEEDDDESVYTTSEEQAPKKEADGRPSWMRSLQQLANSWLKLIPPSLQTLRRTVENIKDPLYRYFEREVNRGAKLLQDVRNDLNDVVLICNGAKKQTNYHRTMISNLAKGIIPISWCRYTVPQGVTVMQWITDFAERVVQLQAISQATTTGGAKELKNVHIWLGGLFNPEAYITATRQCVAQANSWSLEELMLDVTVVDSKLKNVEGADCVFVVTGLKMQGATCENNQLMLTSAISTDLKSTALRWIRQQPGQSLKKGMITLPVYLNSTRAELLFTIDLELAKGQNEHNIYERGVALFCSASLG